MNKKDIILDTTLKLVNREGFYHLNMKKLAKEAGIAAGTTYLYFNSKEMLINELYKKVVREYQAVVMQEYVPERTLKENVAQMVGSLLQFYIQRPDYFSFLEQYTYSPFLFKESQEEHFSILEPLYKILQHAKEQKQIKDLPEPLLFALIYGPVHLMIHSFLANKSDLTDPVLQQQLIEACWQNIAL
jgi:AcrR family transcriptional regulator